MCHTHGQACSDLIFTILIFTDMRTEVKYFALAHKPGTSSPYEEHKKWQIKCFEDGGWEVGR